MEKKSYVPPCTEMVRCDFQKLLSESKWNDGTGNKQIIEGNPEYDIDAKGFTLWGDDEFSFEEEDNGY